MSENCQFLPEAAHASITQRLERYRAQGTAAERSIAGHMLAHLHHLPFETAASLAGQLALSEATIGRFCRKLGFLHFKDLKQGLRNEPGDSPWLMGERLQEFLHHRAEDGPDYTRSLELSIAAQVAVYEMTRSPQWRPVIERLADVPAVLIAGFQTERGIAACMAHMLQYIRPGVHLIDNAAGHYSDALLTTPDEAALMVFDARRYSRHTLLLCERAHRAGLPVTLVTDPYCDWADSRAREVFRVPTDLGLFSESTAPMLIFAHLVINEVFVRLGARAEHRLEQVSTLSRAFVGYTAIPGAVPPTGPP